MGKLKFKLSQDTLPHQPLLGKAARLKHGRERAKQDINVGE